jgi:hypothetical protein
MKFAALALLAVLPTWAHATPTEFPEGAMPVEESQLKELLSGKVFTVNVASGPAWRWQFNGNGYVFINIGSFSDGGQWRTQGSTLCTEGRKIKASCNEMRAVGNELYLKRDNGEVVRLTAQ